jgi:hypothetical protein
MEASKNDVRLRCISDHSLPYRVIIEDRMASSYGDMGLLTSDFGALLGQNLFGLRDEAKLLPGIGSVPHPSHLQIFRSIIDGLATLKRPPARST